MAGLHEDITEADVAELARRKDLMAIAELRRCCEAVDRADVRSPDSRLARRLDAAYQTVLRDKVGHIIVLVQASMWAAKECQALHREVAASSARFAAYTAEDYLSLWGDEPQSADKDDADDDELDLPEVMDEEELDGYASDDSDDEEEPVPPPSGLNRGQLLLQRRKRKHQKQRQKERVEKGTVRPKGAPHTWRTYGALEPDPNAIIQHVVQLRRQLGKRKDGLQVERDKLGRELQDATRRHTATKAQLEKKQQQLQDTPEKSKARREQLTRLCESLTASEDRHKKRVDAVKADMGPITARSKELEEDFQRHNPAIRHPPSDWTAQAEQDFQHAKVFFAQNDAQALAGLKTKFAIAQYRGITYNNLIFNQSQRRLSRNRAEVGQPVYSMSVLIAAGVRPDDYFEGRCTSDEMDRLDEAARRLKQVLLEKRAPARVVVNGYTYASHADAIQDIYTNKYDYIHATIQRYLDHRDTWKKMGIQVDKDTVSSASAPGQLRDYPPMELWTAYDPERDGPKKEYLQKKLEAYEKACAEVEAHNHKKLLTLQYGVIPPSDWVLFDGLLNGKNPFVSTGDTPRHALKYAYGMKFYSGHDLERLQPRWNAKGKALHPYSGKVFVSLHSLEEYLEDAPNHVPSMNMQARIVVGDAIADERETTFPAFIPGERVIMEHICKYPSFHRPWRGLYLRKYGLDADMFAEFAAAVLGSEVQSDGAYRNVESWLVNFHEARLVELARQQALSRGMLLVYRNSHGELSRELTSTKVHKASRFIDPATRKWTATLEQRGARRQADATKDQHADLLAKGSKPSASPQGKAGAARPRTFRQRIAQQGYAIHNVRGDGNCFFHALLAAANHAGLPATQALTHDVFRQVLVDEYANYADIRAQQNATPQYIAQMRQTAERPGQISRWGSDAELILFCRHYDMRVRILSPRYPNDMAEFVTFGTNPARTLYLVHEGGDHWQWALPPP